MMRLLPTVSIAALILTGPAALPLPLAAHPHEAEAGDADRICASYLAEYRERRDFGSVRKSFGPRPLLPPPPPPSSPPPPPAPVVSGAEARAVIGQAPPRVVMPASTRYQNRERYAGEEVATVQAVA